MPDDLMPDDIRYCGPRRSGAALFRCLAWLVLAVAMQAQAQSIFGSGFELAKAQLPGGSNLHWYALGPDCDREPYGIVANYHEFGVRDVVRSQLAELRARGQDQVALGLFHSTPSVPTLDGRVTGTVLDSTGRQLQPQYLQNLADLLADVRAAGFQSFLFRYFPQGRNDAKAWESLDAARLDDNWGVIRSIEPLLRASGVPYLTDLLAEGMPRAEYIEVGGTVFIDRNNPERTGWSEYARELWARYVREFGTSNSFGFGFVSDTADARIDARVEHKDYVYTVDGQLRLPIALALDLYGTPERDERWIFERYRKHLVDEGVGQLPWFVTEAYYDDAASARALAEAMTATGHPILYLTQWPLRRDLACDPDVNVTPPFEYGNYARFGF